VEVPFLDLRVNDPALKKELISRVEKILSHGRIVEGPEQEEFEKKFASEIGVKYALGVGSGSSALYLALLGLGVGPGDEVITTPFTWIITVNAIVATGAKPVFVDVQDDFNIDPDEIEKSITPKTKAIVPMHVGGHVCDMTSISRIARDNHLFIVEDAAQAFCSLLNGKRAGAFSHAAGFSMNPMKILHAYGEAGAVTTNNKKVYNRIKQMRHAGTNRDKEGKHINRCNYFALNHKIDTIQASLLISTMDRINEIKVKRDQIASLYDEAFSDILGIQKVNKGEVHGRYIYIMACKKRDGLRKYLLNNGVENKVFYSPLVCDAKVFKNSFKNIKIPAARRLLNQSLSIPLHEKMTIKQTKYVIDTIHSFYN
jgi:dTDP-4-amino-4,6-dideoxygalactose transaminase